SSAEIVIPKKSAVASKIVSEFERRAARAEVLALQTEVAREPLQFAAGLYRVQGRIAAVLEAAHGQDAWTGHLEEDVDRFLDQVSRILRYAAEEGPEVLAGEARARQQDLPSTSRSRLLVYWNGDRPSTEDYLSRSILRPYVELLRSINRAPDRVHRRGECPFCGGAPWISARREGSLMEGARRMLGCALCGGEWLFGRILCPSCAEGDPHKLPSFQNEKHKAVRIEACETCHRYVKSIDLSEDARPIPEVDDLVSLSMDLWAVEQGFTRIEPGLAGL
ncbi:MAG TPA: formate dehydrogenase accessory protein FdhE, partial [Thermoanaerobaculia bacterium]|nr:formate dehydrogenase accessory protein FdhE [Thermoanaerobaculia bacterium]